MCWSTCSFWLTHEWAHSTKYTQIMDIHSSCMKDLKRKFTHIADKNLYFCSFFTLIFFFVICIISLYSLNSPDLRSCFFSKKMLKFQDFINMADFSEVSKVLVHSCLVWHKSKSLLWWAGMACLLQVHSWIRPVWVNITVCLSGWNNIFLSELIV